MPKLLNGIFYSKKIQTPIPKLQICLFYPSGIQFDFMRQNNWNGMSALYLSQSVVSEMWIDFNIAIKRTTSNILFSFHSKYLTKIASNGIFPALFWPTRNSVRSHFICNLHNIIIIISWWSMSISMKPFAFLWIKFEWSECFGMWSGFDDSEGIWYFHNRKWSVSKSNSIDSHKSW